MLNRPQHKSGVPTTSNERPRNWTPMPCQCSIQGSIDKSQLSVLRSSLLSPLELTLGHGDQHNATVTFQPVLNLILSKIGPLFIFTTPSIFYRHMLTTYHSPHDRCLALANLYCRSPRSTVTNYFLKIGKLAPELLTMVYVKLNSRTD